MQLYLNTLIEYLDAKTPADHFPENNDSSKGEDVQESTSSETLLIERILYVSEPDDLVAVIDICGDDGYPVLRKYSEIKAAVLSGDAKILETDPFISLSRPTEFFSEKSIKKRDDAWKDFKELIGEENEYCVDLILDSKTRGERIRNIAKDCSLSRTTLNKWLKRYFKSGFLKNALLPEFEKCGGKGKRRLSDDPNGTKLGRPPRNWDGLTDTKGIRVTAETEHRFLLGYNRFFKTGECSTLAEAFKKTKEKYFHAGYNKIDGVLVPILPPEEKLPSYEQFWYWYDRYIRNPREETIAREGKIEYLQNKRPLTGTAAQMAHGPGSLLQFDATIPRIYLVNSLMPERIIGRPVGYLGVDTFSVLIAGFAITLEGPSWKGAMLALDNVATDKVKFCAELGTTIEEDEWAVHHVFEGILADRGEMKGYKAEPLTNLGCRILTTAPRRPDMKPFVERHLGIAEEAVIKFTPGYTPRIHERGDPDYVLNASLTLNEVRRLYIDYILEYNEAHYMKDYKKSTFMIADHVKRYPQDIWNWGIRNRSGHLRTISQDILRLNLLPRKVVTVTPRGIHLEGELYYVSEYILEQGWLDRTEGKRRRVEVAYHPDFADVIYLPLDDGLKMDVCYLTEASKHLKGTSWYESVDYFATEYAAEKAGAGRKAQRSALRRARKESIIENSLKRRHDALTKAGNPSKLSRKDGIRQNRAMEKIIDDPFDSWQPPLPQDAVLNNLTTEDSRDEEYVPRRSYIQELRQSQEEEE